jgi:hypothetical protein
MVRFDEAESGWFGRKLGRNFMSEQATHKEQLKQLETELADLAPVQAAAAEALVAERVPA